jgi:hypothetical protein
LPPGAECWRWMLAFRWGETCWDFFWPKPVSGQRPWLRLAAPAMAPGGLWARGYLGSYLARKGDSEGARRVLAELLALRQERFVQATAIAAVYTGLGEVARAVEWLEQAAQVPGGLHFWLSIDPVWKPLAGRPGFQRILARWGASSPGTPISS